MGGGAGQPSGHHLLGKSWELGRPGIERDRRPLLLQLDVFVECPIAQDEITDSIGAAPCEVLQVAIVVPVDDSLWQP